MKQLFIFCFCLCLLFTGELAAQQKQGANWYFGEKAGLSFNSAPPAPEFSGESSAGGAASISDANGNLLFYSDGSKVFNKHHSEMPNGNLKTLGNTSSSKVMIVQKPGSNHLYYLFSALNLYGNTTPNFAYSIVDMRLDGGKGDVIANSKNSIIFQKTIASKLTAAMHANNNDIWVIVHSLIGNEFYSFLISESGIANPAKTSIGETYSAFARIGTMKSSPNSSFICDIVSNAQYAQLLDFNRINGILTNA